MSHRHLLIIIIGVLAILFGASAASGQEIFVTPGAPRLTATGVEVEGELAFIDADGFAWAGTRCHHPSDGPGVPPRHLVPSEVLTSKSRVFALLAPDGSSVHALVDEGQGGLRFFSGHCDDAPDAAGVVGQELPRLRWQDSPFVEPVSASGGATRAWLPSATLEEVLTTTPNGRFCLYWGTPTLGWTNTATKEGFYCIDPHPTSDPPAVERLFGPDDLDRWLTPDPHHGWVGAEPGAGEPEHVWVMRTFTWLPDGRLAFVPEVRWGQRDGPQIRVKRSVRYVVLWAPGGAPTIVFDPVVAATLMPLAPGLDPTAGLRHLSWDESRGALWALVDDWDFQNRERTANGGETVITSGWSGTGLRLFGLDGGTGYLSLSAEVARVMTCDGRESVPGTCIDTIGVLAARFAPDGRFYVSVPRTWQGGRGNTLFTLAFDEAKVDLDGDGLAAADEARLGSSDRFVDGDGGGTADGLEVLFGHDPTDAVDDPAHTPVVSGHRTMIRGLPLGLPLEAPFMPSRSVRGPLCDRERCIYREGGEVPNPLPASVESGMKSADGRLLVGFSDDGDLIAATIADGVTETLVRGSRVRSMLGEVPPVQALFPVDDSTTWVMRSADAGGDGRLYRVVDGELALVFDLERARCDSGLGDCDPARDDGHIRTWALQDLYDPITGPAPSKFTPLGHAERLDAFLIGVIGVWDRWLLAVSPEGRVSVVQRTPGLAGARGESFVGRGDGAAGYPFFPAALWASPEGGLDSGAFGWKLGPELDQGFAPASTYPGGVTAGWGDVLVHSWCCGTWEDGLWSSFIEPAAAAPGDVLLLQVMGTPRREGDGAMLYRLPARGGMVSLWPERVPWIHAAEGLDIRASDGRMCVADSRSVLHLMERDGSGSWQVFDRGRVADGIRDCRFDASGRLVALFDDPPRIAEAADDGSFSVIEELDADREPLELIAEGGDGWRVLYADEGIRGALALADGRLLTVVDGELLVDLLLDGVPWLEEVSPLRVRISSGIAFRVQLVELPDGSVGWIARGAVSPGGGVGFDGNFDQAHPDGRDFLARGNGQLSLFEAEAMHAVVVVPGGIAVDPWRGPASADTPDDDAKADQSGGEGCGGGGARVGLLGLLVAFIGRGRGWGRPFAVALTALVACGPADDDDPTDIEALTGHARVTALAKDAVIFCGPEDWGRRVSVGIAGIVIDQPAWSHYDRTCWLVRAEPSLTRLVRFMPGEPKDGRCEVRFDASGAMVGANNTCVFYSPVPGAAPGEARWQVASGSFAHVGARLDVALDFTVSGLSHDGTGDSGVVSGTGRIVFHGDEAPGVARPSDYDQPLDLVPTGCVPGGCWQGRLSGVVTLDSDGGLATCEVGLDRYETAPVTWRVGDDGASHTFTWHAQAGDVLGAATEVTAVAALALESCEISSYAGEFARDEYQMHWSIGAKNQAELELSELYRIDPSHVCERHWTGTFTRLACPD